MDDMNEQVTETMTAEEARAEFDNVLDTASCRRARVVVERDGQPVAVIVSVQDLSALRVSDFHRRALAEAIEKTRAAFADVPDEELEREIEQAIAEVRAEMRAEREAYLRETAEQW